MPLRAADLENLETLIRQGVELRRKGRDVEALPLFQRAYDLSRTPRTAGQLGLGELAIGYWLDAEKHLSEAVSFPEHPWVSRNVTSLMGALESARRNISDVTIEGSPPGAEVRISGQPTRHLPLASPIRMAKGVADIEVSAPGYITATRSLRIAGGAMNRLTIVLAEAPAAPLPILSAAQEGETANHPVTRSGEPFKDDAAEHSKTRPRRAAAWTTAAVAGVSLAFGVVEAFAWAKKHDEFDSHLGRSALDPTQTVKNCGGGDQNYGGQGCQQVHDELVRARTLTFVGGGLAATLGITSAILFTAASNSRSSNAMAFTCTPDLGHRAFECGLSF